MLLLRSDSLAATHAIAAAVAASARSGDVVVLAGEMGAGKTAFAQGFGAAFGVTDHMTSPTYNLVHSHPVGPNGKLTLHHADLYRLTTQHEVADLAFAELAEADGVLLVEWGDVVGASLGDHLFVRLDTADPAVAHGAGLDAHLGVELDADLGSELGARPDAEGDRGAAASVGDLADGDSAAPSELADEGVRWITVMAVGRSWMARWDRLESVLGAFAC